MSEQPEERPRGKSLLVSQLAQQKRGSYFDDDLYDEDLDEESQQAEPERPAIPTKLPRVTPSVSLSAAPSVNTLKPSAGVSLNPNPVLKSLVISTTNPAPTFTSFTGRPVNTPTRLPPIQPKLPLSTGGRLEGILLNDPLSIRPVTLPKRGRPRGRPKSIKSPGDTVREVTDAPWRNAQSLTPAVPKRARRIESQHKNAPLLLPLRESHPRTNMALPLLNVAAQFDVLAAVDSDKKPAVQSSNVDDGTQSASINHSASISSQSVPPCRMKTSTGLDDLDIQILRNNRRLNGYNLFVFMNKRKYESNTGPDEVSDSADSMSTSQKENLKWQAIWSTLSEKERREWKAKARRIVRQNQQRDKQDSANSRDKRWSERRKLERQLARNDVSFATNNLMDIAAYFQLLSDAFAGCASQLDQYEGPVNTEGVESLLLDGLLACLIPLLALVSEEEALSSALDKDHVSVALKHLTYILPL